MPKTVGKPCIQVENVGSCPPEVLVLVVVIIILLKITFILTTCLKHGKLRIVSSQGQLTIKKRLHVLPSASLTIWIKQKQL